MSLIKEKNSCKMKKYNDIGDLYREMFSDYAPEPPASVWEGIKSATQKKPPMWKKITFPFAGTVLVGAVVYLLVVNPNPKESAIANDKQENTENQVFDNKVSIVENLSDVSVESKKTVSQQENQGNVLAAQSTETTSLAAHNSSNDNSEEEMQTVVTERISDKKTPVVVSNTSDAQNQEQNPAKIVRSENPLPKVLPVKISKDTTVCENAAVQLYAYNAENIRWNTGETKNIITVYPSYREQYSVTFNTANAKDTTVYIHINVVKCAEVHIPNAFTPNGDNLNDIFLAKTDMDLKSFEMVIYSANGRQVLFTSKDINRGWDGTYRGQPQPHGLYYYTIRYTDNSGKQIEKHGELLLILR